MKPIELKPIELQIQLPAILKSKFVTISVDENDTIKDIKAKLIKKALSMPSCKEFKYIDFSLFYLNKELDDKTLYKDIKCPQIECKFIFNFICTNESSVKFENFKGVLEDKKTICDYRKIVFEKTYNCGCRNIQRISFKVQNSESNVEEIRKQCGYNKIIKSTFKHIVLYDDMPLFSIPGNIDSSKNDMPLFSIQLQMS